MKSLSVLSKRSVVITTQRILVWLGVGVSVLLLCLPASAQLNLGRILGNISDQSGGVIVGATVTVLDVPRGVARNLTTDSAGGFSASSLVPSTYTVKVEFKGFKTIDRQNVEVGVGQDVRLDLTLQPGDQAQTVTVTEAIPIIDTTNAVLSSTLQTEALSELPINGRLFTKVLDFQPGIHGNPGGNSPNYESNGAGGQGNYFLLDGVENSNIFVNSGPLIGAATSTDELTILPQDAVQEVNVMANPPAEFGWFQGAVVNVGLKSGTNNVHGTAYGFGRNNSLDAYNPYLGGAPTPKQDDNFEQFGGSLGGPIKKDKLFYFGAFDGMRYTVGTAQTAIVPTVNGGAVDVTTNSVPLQIEDMINNHSVSPSPLSLSLSDCTVSGSAPAAVATCGTKGVFRNGSLLTNNIGVLGDSSGHSNNVFGRIDYHPNDRSSINGEYFFGQATTRTPNVGAPSFWDNLNVSRTQMMRAVWTYARNSNWVNDVRFGYNRYNLADGNAECAGGNFSTGNVGQPDYKALGFISGANPPSPFCGFPAVNFNSSGNPSWGALSFFISDQGVFQATYTGYDNVSYTHGRHNFKFGFEFHHSRFRGIGAPGYLDGVLNFDGGNAFGACDPTSIPACPFGGMFPASTDLQDYLGGALGANNLILVNPQQELTSLGFNREALYFSDNFRLNSRVTVNLGLRYELEPAILVDNNSAGNFDPFSPTGTVQQNGTPLYKADHKAFAPRAGFAWDITGKGTTVLRAGMGVSYDTPQVDDLIAQGFGAGLNSIPTGFNFYNDNVSNNNGLVFAASQNPQAVQTAVVSLPGSALTWASNVPVFPANLNGDLTCGTGHGVVNPDGTHSGVVLPDGVVPSPCTLKARGTVYKLPNGQLAMNTSQVRSPMYTWTLGIQHAFGASTSLTVNYVGTHTSDLSSEINVNQPAPGARAGLQQRQPYYSQFPWFNGIFVYGPAGFSNYNALQASFVLRNFHGLTLNAGYTFSRDLATPKGGNNPYITNSQCVACDYGLRTPTQDLGVTLVYTLPGIKSPVQLLQGWQISSTINLQSGEPFSGLDGSDDFAGVGGGRGLFGGASEPWTLVGKGTNFNNIGKLAQTPCFGVAGSRFAGSCTVVPIGTGLIGTASYVSNLPAACVSAAANEPVNSAMNSTNAGSSNGLLSLAKFGCYMQGNSVIIPPAQGTFGNMRPGSLIGAPFHEWDLSLSKAWKIHERFGLQATISAFNVLNSFSYAVGNGGPVNVPSRFGVSGGQPSDGNPVNGTGGAREVLLGLKASF